jgi:hypothetical protein
MNMIPCYVLEIGASVASENAVVYVCVWVPAEARKCLMLLISKTFDPLLIELHRYKA